MLTQIDMQDGTILEFPESMSSADIRDAIKTKYLRQGGDETDEGELASAERTSDLAAASKEAAKTGERAERIGNILGQQERAWTPFAPQNIASTIVNAPSETGYALARMTGAIPSDTPTPRLGPLVGQEEARKAIRTLLKGASEPSIGEVRTTPARIQEGIIDAAADLVSGWTSPEAAVAMVSGNPAAVFAMQGALGSGAAVDALLKAKDAQEVTRATLGLAGTGLMVAAPALHSELPTFLTSESAAPSIPTEHDVIQAANVKRLELDEKAFGRWTIGRNGGPIRDPATAKTLTPEELKLRQSLEENKDDPDKLAKSLGMERPSPPELLSTTKPPLVLPTKGTEDASNEQETGTVTEAPETTAEPVPKVDAAAILARNPGETTLEEIMALTDDDWKKLATVKDDKGNTIFKGQLDSPLQGLKYGKEDVARLEAIRDEAQKENMTKLQAGKFDDAASGMGRVVWLNGLIEGAKREGPNYRDAIKSQEPAQAEKPPVTTPVTQAEQGILGKLDAAADRAKARIATRSGLKFGSGPDPWQTARDVVDWATIGAAKLARGGYDVAKWSAEMVREFGDAIKPHLEDAWRHAQRIASRMKAGVEQERTDIGQILGAGVDERRANQSDFGAALMQSIIKERGQFDPKEWFAGMSKEFGDDVQSEPVLEQLYQQSRDAMSEGVPVPSGRNPTPFTKGQKRITVGEKTALREVLAKAQSAGEHGRKAGVAEGVESQRPAIEALREKLADSIPKLKALGQYFAGQARGAARATADVRKDAERIDRWLEADSQNIRESLLKLAGELPVSERGRFVSAITSAMQRPSLFSGDVMAGGKMVEKAGPLLPGQKPQFTRIGAQKITAIENMYRRAAKVASQIENRISEVEIRNLETEIGKFKKWGESAGVDVEYRKQIRSELENFNRLKKAGGLDRDALQALQDRLTSLRDIGRSEQTTKEALWQWQKDFAEQRLTQQPTRPVETRPELRPSPGEKTPISMRLKNWLNNARNKADVLDKALMPIDALFDLMEDAKGKYTGWLFRHARGPVDLGFNNATVKRNGLLARFNQFVKDTGLTAQSAERIGVYAQNLQEGGRQRLVEMGLPEAEIDRISSSLTNNEKAAYRLMRRVMDSQLPAVRELMRKLYNTEVKSEPNYFPMPRDWRVFEDKPEGTPGPGTEAGYDELATWRALIEDLSPKPTTAVRKGFTIERQKGAQTPIRIDAFDIFRQHINDVSYLLEMQPTLKQLGELGRGDLFRAKYGNVGRKIFLDWLDTVSRQGGVESFKRWKLLDAIRKNTSVGVIGFRLASQFVHESNVPYIYARIGNWFGTGMRESFTDRGKAFIQQHFAETQERGGGEPAQVEAEKGGVKLAGMTVIPEGVVKASYAIARGLDRFNSQASTLGTYLKLLKDKGADWQNYDSIPVDPEAKAQALVLARRAIASPLPKDVPQALSRGRLTGGNVSLGRTLFQFQNIFLDQWSNIRHDFYQAGIREKNPKLAAQMAIAILGATALETAIKLGTKKAIQTATGAPPAKEEDPAKKALIELGRRFPFGGQIESQLIYGESGIPALDATLQVPKGVKAIAEATSPRGRRLAEVGTAAAAAQLAGVPGASQAGDVIKQLVRKPGNATEQLRALHTQFLKNSNDPKLKADFERHQKERFVPQYASLDDALQANDSKSALKAIAKLRETHSDKSIEQRMNPNKKDGTPKALFHTSIETEREFMDTLKTAQAALYDASRDEQAARYERFLELWDKRP